MNNPILEIHHVVKTYSNGPETLTILSDLEIALATGTTSVVLGESGSGKSTILNLIGGLDKPDSGEITVGGLRVDGMAEDELAEFRRKSVGYVFQFHYLLNDFDALDNVMLPLYMTGASRKNALERARELLIRVNLGDRLAHYPHQLSGGERQRVAVARALVNDPALLLADEPTGNLDEKNSEVVEELIFSLAEDFGKSLLLVTHDTHLAERGDARYMLHDGVLRNL